MAKRKPVSRKRRTPPPSKRSIAARQAWATRRAKQTARSKAARKGWETRRRKRKIGGGQKDRRPLVGILVTPEVRSKRTGTTIKTLNDIIVGDYTEALARERARRHILLTESWAFTKGRRVVLHAVSTGRSRARSPFVRDR